LPANSVQPVEALPRSIAVMGLGQMGLVMSAMLCGRDQPLWRSTEQPSPPPQVWLAGHSSDEAGRLAQSRTSPRLPGFRLPERVRVALKPDEALADADLVVSAIPVQYTRGLWKTLKPIVPARAAIVSVAKGIETSSLLRPTQILADVLRDNPDGRPRALGVLSGPTIASELARCLPATMVAASDDPAFAALMQAAFSTSWLRVYTSADVLGVEVAGATKNIIAIAAGVLDGLNAGNNAKSALLARGLAEIARLGSAMGASRETFFGIAGVGDLATSCFSPEGRNRSCGEALGKGLSLEAHLATISGASGLVVEGVATTKAVMQLAAKYRVEMPIVAAVHAVLFEGMDPLNAIGSLMSREPTADKVS
jgi:glycerol-3-phosphate dehydrogenase (NAD(P)+)